MSGSSQSTGSSPAGDGLDLIDLSEYDGMPYSSPSLSPAITTKMQFARPTPAISTPTTLPPNQMLTGPSHQYDQYKQQTPFVPGALANTLAMNDSSSHVGGYNIGYINPGEELFDFNATSPHDPMATPNMDLDFSSPNDPFYFPTTPTISSHTANLSPPPVANNAAGVNRMYPGVHQHRAAMAAKAQAQHIQQQQEIAQRQNQQRRQQQSKQSRQKQSTPNPIVEQKIAQLLNAMRTQASTSEPEDNSPLLQIPRPKKEEDEMDEDERLLASEEGKKLSSKERRQLRNKVSARAFRSRRKEYIGQLENEIATKVTENNDLRAQNRALIDENRRLTDLSKMLLASPCFSSFLDNLSSNPNSLSQEQGQIEQAQTESAQIPKDPNPYHALNMGQQQQIGMAMIPESRMDFSMLNLNHEGFSYQPQVFAVVETPELPQIDTDALMGKSSNFVGESPVSDSDKVDAPTLEAPIPSIMEKPQTPEVDTESVHAEKTVSNLDGDIFDDDDTCILSPRPLELDTDGFSAVDIFGGIESEKAFVRYELVDSSEEDQAASMALRRVERLAASLKTVISGLERLDVDL
ncbi:putative bZIP transcription factor [Rosellinia necatrix]|uniref:Putative bZIP transcription factor n=1 Tax=Rosellinia necatrix TaxID=77044 RepID=A0A1S7UME5_ROSNE|nr:putative bZIP transcription factor [Rosellinia necatrix]